MPNATVDAHKPSLYLSYHYESTLLLSLTREVKTNRSQNSRVNEPFFGPPPKPSWRNRGHIIGKIRGHMKGKDFLRETSCPWWLPQFCYPYDFFLLVSSTFVAYPDLPCFGCNLLLAAAVGFYC